MQTILISGASIAGPTLAYWLSRQGFKVTLVERSPRPRPGGHAIDVRGVALDVLRAMGVLDAAIAQRTQMKGVSRLDAEGNEIWRSDEMTITGGSFDNDDIEILRDDLSALLMGALPEDLEVIYDDSIIALDEQSDGIAVTFERNPARKFHIVCGADGIGSNVRGLTFENDVDYVHPMGVALAIFSAPNHIGLEDWQLDYQCGNHSALLYTARNNKELRVGIGLGASVDNIRMSPEEQMDLVRDRCKNMGWEIPALLEAMPSAPDFYLGVMAQVKMPHWTKGRVALVGDAAYCPSPYSGQGTSLALVGAYVLARELGQSPNDYRLAFANYEKKLKPFVAMNQKIADMANDERFSQPEYYAEIQKALDEAKNGIVLEPIN